MKFDAGADGNFFRIVGPDGPKPTSKEILGAPLYGLARLMGGLIGFGIMALVLGLVAWAVVTVWGAVL